MKVKVYAIWSDEFHGVFADTASADTRIHNLRWGEGVVAAVFPQVVTKEQLEAIVDGKIRDFGKASGEYLGE